MGDMHIPKWRYDSYDTFGPKHWNRQNKPLLENIRVRYKKY